MSEKIDARGRSCPEPVILTQQALKSADSATVLVDNQVAVENITRFCTNRGFAIAVQEAGGEYTLDIKRK